MCVRENCHHEYEWVLHMPRIPPLNIFFRWNPGCVHQHIENFVKGYIQVFLWNWLRMTYRCTSKYLSMTSTKLSDFPRNCNEHLNEWNLRTAIDLDSPKASESSFIGSRTMNLPSVSRRWFPLKSSTTACSSNERGWDQMLQLSTSRNLCRISSPVIEEEKQDVTYRCAPPCFTVQDTTHLNWVLRAISEPDGRIHRPWHTTWLYTSTLSDMSMLQSVP